MKIAVDVDGVLAEQVPHLLKRMREQYCIELRKKDIRLWNQPIGHTDFTTEIERALLDADFVLSMPAIRGARAALDELATQHHVVITTGRPVEASDNTLEWLRRKRLRFHEFVNTREQGKPSLAVDVLIDDHLDSAEGFALTNRLAILLSQPWNCDRASIEPLVRRRAIICAKNWSEVLGIIQKLHLE